MIIQVQLSSKMWHKQLLFIMFPPRCHFERFCFAHYYDMSEFFYLLLCFFGIGCGLGRLIEIEHGIAVL